MILQENKTFKQIFHMNLDLELLNKTNKSNPEIHKKSIHHK